MPNSYSDNVGIDLNCSHLSVKWDAFDPFIIWNMERYVAARYIHIHSSSSSISLIPTFNIKTVRRRRQENEINPNVEVQNPLRNSKIDNINEILVMNADAYIIRSEYLDAQHQPLPFDYLNLWWVSFEISVWICHVKYTDTYAF